MRNCGMRYFQRNRNDFFKDSLLSFLLRESMLTAPWQNTSICHLATLVPSSAVVQQGSLSEDFQKRAKHCIISGFSWFIGDPVDCRKFRA